MKKTLSILMFLFIVLSLSAQKKEQSGQDTTKGRDKVDTKYTEGASGVKRSIYYQFSSNVEGKDPGNGVFRYNSENISKVNYIYLDNNDLSGDDQSKWYKTWEDTTGAMGRGQLNIVEKDGKTVNVFYVTGLFTNENGFWKIPVEYVSGSSAQSGTTFYFVFVRIAKKDEKKLEQVAEAPKVEVIEQKREEPVKEAEKIEVIEPKKVEPIVEAPKVEVVEPKKVEPVVEASKVEVVEPKKVEPVAEVPKVEVVEPIKVEPVVETPKVEVVEPKKVEPVAEAPKVEVVESKKVEPVVETPKVEVVEPKKVEPVVETPKVEVVEPKKVEPVAEAPKVEVVEPKKVEPVAEAPKVEVVEPKKVEPVVEAPKVEVVEPKKVEPVAEAPKVEDVEQKKVEPVKEQEKVEVIEQKKVGPKVEVAEQKNEPVRKTLNELADRIYKVDPVTGRRISSGRENSVNEKPIQTKQESSVQVNQSTNSSTSTRVNQNTAQNTNQSTTQNSQVIWNTNQDSRATQKTVTSPETEKYQTSSATRPNTVHQDTKPASQTEVVQTSRPAAGGEITSSGTLGSQGYQTVITTTDYNSSRPPRRKWWHGIIEAGYGFGLGEYGMDNFRLNFISAFSIGKCSSIGLGIGFRRYFIADNPVWYSVSGNQQVPVFLDLRTTFSRRKLTPYLALGIGNSARFGTTPAVHEGLYFSPSGGLWLNVSDRFAVFGGVAYELQKLEFANFSDDIPFKKNAGSISINLGISF